MLGVLSNIDENQVTIQVDPPPTVPNRINENPHKNLQTRLRRLSSPVSQNTSVISLSSLEVSRVQSLHYDHGLPLSCVTSQLSMKSSVSLAPDDPLNTLVGDVCDTNLLLLPEYTLLEDAIIALSRTTSESVIITNDTNEYCKFLTQKELTFKTLCNGMLNDSMTLRELIENETKDVKEIQCVSNSNTLFECLCIMRQNNVDSIAVVEGVTGIIGIMRIKDVIKFMSDRIIEKRKPKRKLTKCERIINDILESIFFQIIYVILLIAYMLVTLIVQDANSFHVVSCLSITILLFIISLMRSYLIGCHFLKCRDKCENCVLLFAVIFSILMLIPGFSPELGITFFGFNAVALVIHFFCITPCRIYENTKKMKHSSKKAVSKNKARYQKDGFDLDLTYITTRCIAMSLPAEKIESLYRNPIKEVARFFDTKHPESYMIYNLCNERDYDSNYFHGRVKKYPIPDHNVPTLYNMHRFANDARIFLSLLPQNVIAVHCKGGKGRTGCMICAYMLNSGVACTAQEALERFANRRTIGEIKNQGVSCPSQKRFIFYYEDFLKDLYSRNENPDSILKMSEDDTLKLFDTIYSNREVIIESITIRNLPKINRMRFVIYSYDGMKIYISSLYSSKNERNVVIMKPNIRVKSEFRFELKNKFHIWQHSFFVKEKEIYFKAAIDGVFNNPNYSDSFSIEFHYKLEDNPKL